METPSKSAPAPSVSTPSANANASTAGKPENPPPAKSVLELLEEDDEFEEFEGTTWEDNAAAGDDGQLWQDDWEDDDISDDFVQQLRAQIESKPSTSS